MKEKTVYLNIRISNTLRRLLKIKLAEEELSIKKWLEIAIEEYLHRSK